MMISRLTHAIAARPDNATHVRLGLEVLRNLVEERLHVLAVPAPWCSERDKNVLLRVHCDVVEGIGVELEVRGRWWALNHGLDACFLRYAEIVQIRTAGRKRERRMRYQKRAWTSMKKGAERRSELSQLAGRTRISTHNSASASRSRPPSYASGSDPAPLGNHLSAREKSEHVERKS